MDEIIERLKTASSECIKIYEDWHKNSQSTQVREALQESIHELRKVASRLEIEVAMSERDQMASKPIPIPPHRSSRKKHPQDQDHGNFPQGNDDDNGDHQPQVETVKKQRRGRKPKQASGE